MSHRIGSAFCTFLALLVATALAHAEPPPVTAVTRDAEIVINNGLVEISVSRTTGQLTSIADVSCGHARPLATSMYWDANAEVADPPAGMKPVKKGYFRFAVAKDLATLVEGAPDRAEVSVKGGPAPFFQFRVDYRYVMLRGVSGFYAYAVFTRPPGLPAAKLWQTRFVVHTVEDETFDRWAVGADKMVAIPTAAAVGKLMDATWRLADGTVKTKYQNSVYWAQTPVYGVLGKGGGLWMIEASPEYHNGGPVKQGQTVHDRVLLRVLQSAHFGASGVDFAEGEPWQKVYGPFLVYVNHGNSPGELWADADRRQREEKARWPYAWVDSPEYGKARGAVSGRLRLTDGASAAGAWVILAAPGDDWTAQGKGYQFWTKAGADGRFEIPKVLPGSYTLYASGADQPQDFAHDGVRVDGNETTDVGTLDWTPVKHGTKLWQIGVFDRSAGEFRNGDDARQYQMFTRYPEQFPNDVVYTIGKSDPRKDWNYAQWSWYAKDPLWRIRFDLKDGPAAAGTATLTLGFASAQPAKGKETDLRVGVNGTEVAAIHLPKTGTAGYRGGTQDSPYHLKLVTFDAKLLRAGPNEVTLGHADAAPFHALAATEPNENEDAPPGTGYPGQVMYDAIRLEVQP